MNAHLNLFRHYSASEDQQVLENNLTRALALCLQHDTLFLYSLLGTIVGEEELRRHLDLTDNQERLEIDVQQSVRDLGPYAAIYAVAITGASLNAATYETVRAWRNESPITDLTIRYKDVLVLVEVKRTGEDCLAQLKGQVEAYQEAQGEDHAATVQAKALSWAQVVRLATNTRNLHQLTGHASPYTTDFVQYIQYHYPHWDEVLPFRSIPFERAGAINESALYKRLHYIQQQAFGDKLKWYNSRVAMPINVKWASEVITNLRLHDGKPYIVASVWPANTKQQGWPIFSKSLAWVNTTELTVDGQVYGVEVEEYIKFSHFNRYLFEIPVYNDFMSRSAFDKYAGKWNRDSWPELEALLDQDTKKEWRRLEPAWKKHFVDTDRNYAAVALGFAVSVYLPYSEFQQLDTSTENWQPVAQKLEAVTRALVEMIDGPTNA
ncbi:hypothetical protein D0N36_14265 [Hymenobacter lapidiphilus]|uniref:hypothetical protein n=1 Tax=Hymenobacter sp. CCM 8763 TaxID=2303334 RepID=UPI000E357D1B|nr:hypothetical protein [Hymenobacter sp. CCM 8763]RFP64351.1 hypothetical protein D0N36_14265 [Hymenobacter sp. CCM 8763]